MAESGFNTQARKKDVVVKVGLIGDVETGKTSLMVKYVEDIFDQDYIETLGVNFMEKTISLKNVNVTFSLWDLGGQREYKELIPLVCSEARVLLFVFDLTKKSSLVAIKQWYKNAKNENKHAIPFLIGAKYDLYDKLEILAKEDITKHARKFAKAMKAPLIYCSASKAINVKKIFQIIISKVFNVEPRVREVKNIDSPIVEFKRRKGKKKKKEGADSSKQNDNNDNDENGEAGAN